MKTFILLLTVLISSSAFAQNSKPWLLSPAAEARAAKRFTLAEWLENKNRNSMMDMWLSLNTPSPYEFMVGGSLNQYTVDFTGQPQLKKSSYDGEFSAYAKFVGLTAEYQNNVEESFHDETGIFNVRLFGHTLQGSNLTVHYGLRTRTDKNGLYRLNQQFAAGTMQLYIMKYFGITGNYRHHFKVRENYYGDTEANTQNFGAFIEFGSLRLMGSFFKENQSSELNAVKSELKREGSKVSLQFFF